jgi:hypothetical protein
VPFERGPEAEEAVAMATDDADVDKPKRVANFRQELLRYQSFRNQQEAHTSDEEPQENKGQQLSQ